MTCGQDIYPRLHKGPLKIVVAAALLDGEGRVLLAQRPNNYVLGPVWEFPGGKMEPGETPEGTLVRELKEELGIDVFTGCLQPLTFVSYAYDNFHLFMPLYVVRQWQGVMVPTEHQNLAWLRPAQMKDYAMPPADLPLVSALQDYLA